MFLINNISTNINQIAHNPNAKIYDGDIENKITKNLYEFSEICNDFRRLTNHITIKI